MDKKLIEKKAEMLEAALNFIRRVKDPSKKCQEGLKGAEKFFLQLIGNMSEKEEATPSEISRRSGVTLAAITHHLNTFEERGLINRSVSKDDRRVVFVALSDEGKKVLKRIKKRHQEGIFGLIEFLGEEDSSKLISLIGKIAKYIEQQKNIEAKGEESA